MGDALASLLSVAHVAVISGGDWPQFQKQVASRLPKHADLSKLWLMPTTGTKLYTYKHSEWQPIYAELFSAEEKQAILTAFDASLAATGFVPEQTWGERIEDRGSQITFSALGQQAPVSAKEVWDPDFAKRKVIQADLYKRLPTLSINMGGSTSRKRVSTRDMDSRSCATQVESHSRKWSSSETPSFQVAMTILQSNSVLIQFSSRIQKTHLLKLPRSSHRSSRLLHETRCVVTMKA